MNTLPLLFTLPVMDRAAEETCQSPTELQEGTELSSLSFSRGVRARSGQTSFLLLVQPPEGFGMQKGALLSHASVLQIVLAHWPYALQYKKAIKLVNCSIQCDTLVRCFLFLYCGKTGEILEIQSQGYHHVV